MGGSVGAGVGGAVVVGQPPHERLQYVSPMPGLLHKSFCTIRLQVFSSHSSLQGGRIGVVRGASGVVCAGGGASVVV